MNFNCRQVNDSEKADFEMPRKKPFSNKQKKKQLQDKREKKRLHDLGVFWGSKALKFLRYLFAVLLISCLVFVVLFSFYAYCYWYVTTSFKGEEKSSNDGNSADTEGEGESEIGDIKLPDSDRSVKLHNQPVRQDGQKKHDPNRSDAIFIH